MAGSRDRRLVLGFFGVVLVSIVAFSIFAPANDDTDQSPTTYNSGSAGTKAAYLLLGELGYRVDRWDAPSADLKSVDAAKAVLVLVEPFVPVDSVKAVQADIADFISRGGRVLATGQGGAFLLPEARTGGPTRLYEKLCFTTPEGPGPLARAGQVSMSDRIRWTELGPAVRVSQACGKDAVVVSYKYGAGEAIGGARRCR